MNHIRHNEQQLLRRRLEFIEKYEEINKLNGNSNWFTEGSDADDALKQLKADYADVVEASCFNGALQELGYLANVSKH